MGTFLVAMELGAPLLDPLIRMSSFSMRFSTGLSRRLTGPRDVVICLRLSTSAWLMVRVSMTLGRKTKRKVATPMMRFVRLLNVIWVWIA